MIRPIGSASLPASVYVCCSKLYPLDESNIISTVKQEAGLGSPVKRLRLCLVPKKFAQYPSHQIFGHIYEALNAVEKITNYII